MNRKKNALALAAILTAAAAMPTGAFAENWADYARKFQISFPGYAGSTALADFPVLVRLSPERNGFDYAKCRIAKGGDLRFADAEGNLLPHEIDTWNPDGESTVWVKVPSLTKDTAITAYYGNPSPCAASAESVWDSGYVAVWHLGESALPLAESTGVSTPFSTQVGTVTLGAAGIAGGAVDFSNPETDTRLVAADDDNLDGFDSFTIEIWTKSDTTATSSGKGILSKQWNGSANVAYNLIHETNGYGLLQIGPTGGGSRQNLVNTKEMLPAANVWTHQVYVRDTAAEARYCYLDGVSKSPGGAYYGNTLHNSVRPLWLGNYCKSADNSGSGVAPFNGLIDELRISRVARSADWIQATHDTVAADGFATVSAARENSDATLISIR